MEKHTFDQCAKERRSIRAFNSKAISQETLEELVTLGTLAPSGSNIQACKYVVVDRPELLSKIKMYAPGLNGSPAALILLCTDMQRIAEHKGGKLALGDMACFDVAMAAENILLGAVDKGLGGCAVRSFDPKLIARLLALPEFLQPQLMLSLGYPEKTPVMPRRLPLTEVMRYNGWEA